VCAPLEKNRRKEVLIEKKRKSEMLPKYESEKSVQQKNLYEAASTMVKHMFSSLLSFVLMMISQAIHNVTFAPFFAEHNFNLPSIASTYLGIIHNVQHGRSRFDAFLMLFTTSSSLKNGSHDMVFSGNLWKGLFFFGTRIFLLTFIARNTGTFTISIRDQTHTKEASTRSVPRYVPRSST